MFKHNSRVSAWAFATLLPASALAAPQTSALEDVSQSARPAPPIAASASTSTIYGVDVRQGRSFTSNAAAFVANFLPLGPEARPLYGIDFDATATTLYGIDATSFEIVTIDTALGGSTPTGVLATGIGGLSGLTASPNGTDWYVSEYDGVSGTTLLYSGDITTGVFTLIGTIATGIIIDISMDGEGNLYGFSISDDSLYSIDPVTGAGTLVGPLGLNANFAQGMDFDWSNGALYATVYTGGGTGQFCSIDLATGAATLLDNTVTLNAEMEIAIEAVVPTPYRSIFGVNVRGDAFFQSRTSDFVANYTVVATETRNLYGLDFDSTATTIYGIDADTLEIVSIDSATGISTPTGTLATGITTLSGLTASPDGVTWYVSEYNGTDTLLYAGDISTGVFNLIGTITAGIIIDISMDSRGNLYGFSISDDSLYAIDTTTGAGTVVGPVGLAANFAQGMDFDWSDDVLYATIYTGGGTGQFCAIDTTTGVAALLEDTFPLNAEMEMTVQAAAPEVGTYYCTAVPNVTGEAARILATGSADLMANDLVLTCTNMPPYSFAIFLASQTQDFVPMAGGGLGNLCLGGNIGRGVGGRIYSSGSIGAIKAQVDWTTIPQPSGLVMAMVGDTWNFQTWMRDLDSMGNSTSNYSDAVSVTVQ